MNKMRDYCVFALLLLSSYHVYGTSEIISTLTGCGFANPDGIGFRITRILNKETNYGEFPWMVLILDDKESFRCDGTLIHPSVVLTAAHCLNKNQTYTVRAGDWDTSTIKELYPHQNRAVSSVKIHEDYNSGQQQNDLALLILESPFTLEENVQMACLPPKDTVVENIRCISAGWGNSTILKKETLAVVSKVKCQENLKQKLGPKFNLHQSSICAGGGKDEDGCVGGGGSPLLCPIGSKTNRFQLIGITSWRVGCNQENVPGIYTNIPAFKNWIDKNIKDRNFTIDQYQY